MLTGKRPTDIVFKQGLTLHEWVKNHYPYNLEKIVKQSLLLRTITTTTSKSVENSINVGRDVIFEMIEMGIMCTQYSPSLRPNMINIAQELSWLKQYLTDLIINEEEEKEEELK